MDTVTVCRLCCGDNHIRKGFGGVFSSDTLPQFKNNFNSFIVNLDRQSKPGSHWVAVFFFKETATYFDSYGRPPSNRNILKFIQTNSNKMIYNKYCFQDTFSVTCGYFCIFFLYKKSRNLKLSEMNPTNKAKNELFINRFSKNLILRNCCHSFHDKKQGCVAMINMTSQ